MKMALYASQQALNAYREACWHERLNIMTEHFEEDLQIIVDEGTALLKENERLKARIKELESELHGGTS